MCSARTNERYDLHTHSQFSDGTTSVAEIARLAHEAGLAGFSLTDHDTIGGWEEARAQAAAQHLDFLPGIELSTKIDGASAHLLAYGVDPSYLPLFQELDLVREARDSRAFRMFELVSVDFDISWSDVNPGDGRTLGRPHIADALVRAGYFADRNAVFSEVLYAGSPYYVRNRVLPAAYAVTLVREAGGIPVLGHPAARRNFEPVRRSQIKKLVDVGLWGIELEHPENREAWVPQLAKIASEFGLVVTGASDFHGAGKPNRVGEQSTSGDVVDQIRALVATPR